MTVSTNTADQLTNHLIACEQALLFGRAKRVSRGRASERRSRKGPRKGELATISHKNFICTSPRRRETQLAEKWRSGKQSWLITGQAGTRFVCVSNLVLRGIRLVPRTCFSPQSRRGGSFDLVLLTRILRAEDKSDRVYSNLRSSLISWRYCVVGEWDLAAEPLWYSWVRFDGGDVYAGYCKLGPTYPRSDLSFDAVAKAIYK